MFHLRRRSLLACVLLAGTTLCAQTLDSEQALFLSLINSYRSQNGLAPLQVSPTLQTASQWMSTDMATKNYFSHTDSLGRDPFQRMNAFGYNYSYAGENIAAGNSGAQATFNQWQGSPGHNQNMLNPNYKAIGIGRAYNAGSSYRYYWTTNFGSVVDGTVTPPPAGTRPTITGFAAYPTLIQRGQATTLSWNVSGATSVSIDNNIGDVSRVTSVSVAPQVTTTYRLTATNASGSVSSAVTVTVQVPTADTQAPSTPATLWALPSNETTVSLQWSASTDNVAVTGYQLLRNGAVLTAVPANSTTFTDRTAAAGTRYVYSVRAYDAAGNYSGYSPSATVTTPGAATAVPSAIQVVSGSGQTAVVANTFAARLRTKVVNASAQPVAGVNVTFTAPTVGATAMFTGSGNVATVRTDAAGIAESPAFVANGVAGSSAITAAVSGVATPARFTLTNTANTAPPPPSGAITIFGNAAAPTSFTMMYGPAELGLKFRSDIAGKITGVRFYKHAMDGGTHRGSLWTADGRLLATGTFTNETASGWQTLTFSAPVAIAANTTYVASYHTTSGLYANTGGQLQTRGIDNGTLHVLQHGVAGANGVLLPTATSKFPTWGSFGNNHWVDVIFVR